MKKAKPIEVKSERCKTLYPILMVHGIGYRDNWRPKYWGRIPRVLAENGVENIFYGSTEAWGTVKHNAEMLAKRIEEILAETGAEKVNIITHSKGGLDARCAVSSFNLGGKVASLSTVSTPHHGSKFIDFYCVFPRFLRKFIAFFPNLWFRIFGDKKPDFYKVTQELTTKYSKQFNEENPDAEDVYYQSFGSVMEHFYSDFFLMLPYLVVKIFDGENDGVVSSASAEWTNYRLIAAAGPRGISHAAGVDMRRRRLSKKKVEGKYSDITDFYIELVEGLKNKGF